MHTKYSMSQKDLELINEYFKNNSLNPLTMPLFSMYYDYFRNKGHKLPLETAKSLCDSLTGDDWQCMIISYNHTDGMGDFIGHLYLTQRFKDLFSGLNNIKTRNICFISDEQMHLARGIMQLKMPGFTCSVITREGFEGNVMENAVVLTEYSAKNEDINSDFKTLLADTINTSDLTLNISTPFYKIRGMVEKNSPAVIESDYLMSWLEYGGRTDYVSPLPIKDLCMGIRDEHLGLRIFNDIAGCVSTSTAERAQLLQGIQDKGLLKKILGSENPAPEDIIDFLEKNHLGFAYFGKRDNAKFCGNMFTLLSAGVPDEGNVCIIINPEWVNDLKDNATWKENLLNMGYTSIEFLDEKETLTRVSLVDKPVQDRVLKMIPLAGIQHQDKIKLMAAAAFHGSAGDTSKSEMISSGCSGDFDAALPFIQPISFQREFDNDLLHAIENCKKSPEWKEESRPLREYLDILINKMDSLDNAGILNLIAFIKKNKNRILSGWKQFCHFTATEKNLETSLQEQLVLMNFMNLIKKARASDYVHLLMQVQQSTFLHQNVIALPLILNEFAVFHALFSEITHSDNDDFASKHIDEALLNRILDNLLEKPGFHLQITLIKDVLRYSQKRGFNTDKLLFKVFEKYIRDNDSQHIRALLTWVKSTGLSIKPNQQMIMDSVIREERVEILKLFLSEFGEAFWVFNREQMQSVAAGNNVGMVETLFDYLKRHDSKVDFFPLALQAIKNYRQYADKTEDGPGKAENLAKKDREQAIASYFLANIDKSDAISRDAGKALFLEALNSGSHDWIQAVLDNAAISKQIDESLLRASLEEALLKGDALLVALLFNHLKSADIPMNLFQLAVDASAARQNAVFQFFMEALENSAMIKSENMPLLLPLIQSVFEQNRESSIKFLFKKLKNNGITLFDKAETLENFTSTQIHGNRAESVAFLCHYAIKNEIDMPFDKLAAQAILHDYDAVLEAVLTASLKKGMFIDNHGCDDSKKTLFDAAIENNQLRCLPVLLAFGADSSAISCTRESSEAVKKVMEYQCDFLMAIMHKIKNQILQFNEFMQDNKYSDEQLQTMQELTDYLTNALGKAKQEISNEKNNKNFTELINKIKSEIDLLTKGMRESDKMELIQDLLGVPEKNLDKIFYLFDREKTTFLKIFSYFPDFKDMENLLQEREKFTLSREKIPEALPPHDSTTSMFHALKVNPANRSSNSDENDKASPAVNTSLPLNSASEREPENTYGDEGFKPGTFK